MAASPVRSDPPWLTIARSYLGVTERPGPPTDSTIKGWLARLGAWWGDDETPWCATFVSACLVQAGLPKPRHWYRARALAEYGHDLGRRAYGSIAVLERGGAGHTGFLVAEDGQERILLLGGNQGNRVSIASFEAWRVIGYRWPPTDTWPPVYPLPTLQAGGGVEEV
jgi:uncharacterized protein (TIGR02594 family)